MLSQSTARHGQLVVATQPAQHPQIVDGSVGTRLPQRVDDAALQYRVGRPREGQAGQAEGLIVRQTGFR